MLESTPQLVIICLDGVRPDIAQAFDVFAPPFPVPDTGPRRLRSVFPSSTATAHASFLTGTDTAGHGIVGNRFWNCENVAEIKQRADEPLAALHPYEFSTLTTKSWLRRLGASGVRSAAVHFPHTIDRAADDQAPAVFCLYAPTRRFRLAVPTPREDISETFTTAYFGEKATLLVRSAADIAALSVSIQGEHGKWDGDIEPNTQQRIAFDVAAGRVSAHCSWRQISAETIEVTLSTAVLTMTFGGIELAWDPDDASTHPASAAPSYLASGTDDFFESPRADWIRDVALQVNRAARPDLLLVRFNQIDHAQEFLYWQACRGSAALRSTACDEIMATYGLVERCVAAIAEAIGPHADYMLFSDHGIETVDRHIGLNAVLRACGLEHDMTFQGDSHVAYLYADRELTSPELERLRSELIAADASVRILSADAMNKLRLPLGSPRLGKLAVLCGAHRKFTYGPSDEPTSDVRSASHGNVITDSDMDGMIRLFGPHALLAPIPEAIDSCTQTVEAILELRRHGSR